MKKLFLIVTLLLVMVTTSFVYAQSNPSPTGGNNANPSPTGGNNAPTTNTTVTSKLQNPLKVNSIGAVIILAVDIMIYVGISFAILAIIFVGFKFVMAQGNPAEISKAKEWFLYIIIGLAVLISSKVIVEVVQNTLVKSGVVKEKLWQP